ncbi:hypothetical protein B0H19DRAFT_1244563, partial [Mycena capillaripes]
MEGEKDECVNTYLESTRTPSKLEILRPSPTSLTQASRRSQDVSKQIFIEENAGIFLTSLEVGVVRRFGRLEIETYSIRYRPQNGKRILMLSGVHDGRAPWACYRGTKSRRRHSVNTFVVPRAEDRKIIVHRIKRADTCSGRVFRMDFTHYQRPGDQQHGERLHISELYDQVQPVDAYTRETELYRPFIELANHCIGKKAKIRFCRDDPTIVHGSDAERKPDVVSIWEAALALGGRSSADNLSQGGPGKDAAFHWMELIAFWEFKFVRGGVQPVTPASSSSTQIISPPAAPPPPRKAASKAHPTPSSRELRARPDKPADPQTTTRSSQKRALASANVNPEKEAEPRLQCASYALELLTLIELQYYDRSIIVKSQPFDFAQDTARFITMLKGVANLTANQWGYHSLLDVPRPITLYPNQGLLTHPFDG